MKTFCAGFVQGGLWGSLAGLFVVTIILMLMTGCATPATVRVIPVADNGAALALALGPDAEAQPGFWANNWGKVLSGVVAAGGLYMAADHNGWLKGGNSENTIEKPVAAPIPSMGDGNVIVNGTVGGNVEINYGNASTP